MEKALQASREQEKAEAANDFNSVWTGLKMYSDPPGGALDTVTGKKMFKPRSRELLLEHHHRIVDLGLAVSQAKDFNYTYKVADHIFNWYRPCNKPLAQLTKMPLAELVINCHNRANYVLVRTITAAVSLGAFLTIIEDEWGNHEQLAMHCYSYGEPANDILPKGTILAIKEPYFKHTPKAAYFIVVDHISDIIFLPPTSEEIPEKWQLTAKSQEEWYDEGCGYLMEKNYYRAITCFTEGLNPKIETKKSIKRCIFVGRSKAYNEIGAWEKGLKDAQAAIKMGKENASADVYLQAAWAQYSLQKSKEAIRYLVQFLKLIPDHCFATSLLQRCRQRVGESESGKYDFMQLKSMLAESDFAFFDCYDFTKRVKFRGTGAFAATALSPGDLVLVEKAIVSCTPEESTLFGSYDHYMNERVLGHCPALIRKLVQKIFLNSETFANNVFRMLPVNPAYSGVRSIEHIDGQPVIDTFALYAPIFGALSAEQHANKFNEEAIEASKRPLSYWLHSSIIKQECWPNCISTKLGDLFVVRCASFIRAGEEIIIQNGPLNLEETRNTEPKTLECRCQLHRFEATEEEERLEERKSILNKLAYDMKVLRDNPDPDIDDVVVERNLTIQLLEESYQRLPEGFPRLALADACIQIVDELFTLEVDVVEEIAIYCHRGLTALGYIIPANDEKPRVMRHGLICSQALKFVEYWAHSCGSSGAPEKMKALHQIELDLYLVLCGAAPNDIQQVLSMNREY